MKIEKKFTPGPWVRDQYGRVKANGKDIDFRSLSLLCSGSSAQCAEAEANTALIAAAPDLLEALQTIITTQGQTLNSGAMDKAIAAIAKATQ